MLLVGTVYILPQHDLHIIKWFNENIKTKLSHEVFITDTRKRGLTYRDETIRNNIYA